MSNLNTIAKIIARNDPEAYRKASVLCEPMLSRTHIIPEIYRAIKSNYPELDRTDESILFAATVYTAYSPASLLASGICRAPNGIRKAMCEVMQWNDAPVVNYYAGIAQAYVKNPKFKDRVNEVLSEFQQYSVKSQQTEMF